MRYRKLSSTGDFTFGQGSQNYLVNSPETVAQVVETYTKLWLGEFFLNVNDGIPYPEGVLGKHSQATADLTFKSIISGLPGVVDIANFESTINPDTRKYSITELLINTVYGQTQVQIENQGDF